jgi:hypothetical protein
MLRWSASVRTERGIGCRDWSSLRIYYDSYQEGVWFGGLHESLADAELLAFPRINSQLPTRLQEVLSYDRPDVVLTDDNDIPLLVLERTVEVPSGHNPGQRFARLAQAARCGVPAVYVCPYAAFKHGGETSGPRYMNLRLFKAIDAVMQIERSPITTIRWPVDDSYEIIFGPEKDERLKAYLDLHLDLLVNGDLEQARVGILESTFEAAQELERVVFTDTEVLRPQRYDGPPPSVRIGPVSAHPELVGAGFPTDREIVLYDIGMRNVRSDPYTGMAILYAYLYCGGMNNRTRALVLNFSHIDRQQWIVAAGSGRRKDIRLFREVADAIRFADGIVYRADL